MTTIFIYIGGKEWLYRKPTTPSDNLDGRPLRIERPTTTSQHGRPAGFIESVSRFDGASGSYRVKPIILIDLIALRQRTFSLSHVCTSTNRSSFWRRHFHRQLRSQMPSLRTITAPATTYVELPIYIVRRLLCHEIASSHQNFCDEGSPAPTKRPKVHKALKRIDHALVNAR